MFTDIFPHHININHNDKNTKTIPHITKKAGGFYLNKIIQNGSELNWTTRALLFSGGCSSYKTLAFANWSDDAFVFQILLFTRPNRCTEFWEILVLFFLNLCLSDLRGQNTKEIFSFAKYATSVDEACGTVLLSHRLSTREQNVGLILSIILQWSINSLSFPRYK